MIEKFNLSEAAAKKEVFFDRTFFDSVERLETEGRTIGSGKTANVIVLEDHPGVCLKVVHDKTISKNRANEEVAFLDRANKLGIRVPKPLCSLQTEGNDFILMETIEGSSIRDIIEQDLFEHLPDGFDIKGFFDQLRTEVKKMNKAKIHHRDLHEGNIMVDKDGNPVIIDFGDAKIEYIAGEDPYREIDSKGELVLFPKDEIKVMEVYRQLGTYLRDKGFFRNKK